MMWWMSCHGLFIFELFTGGLCLFHCLFPTTDLEIKDVGVKPSRQGHIEGKSFGHKSFLQYIVFFQLLT